MKMRRILSIFMTLYGIFLALITFLMLFYICSTCKTMRLGPSICIYLSNVRGCNSYLLLLILIYQKNISKVWKGGGRKRREVFLSLRPWYLFMYLFILTWDEINSWRDYNTGIWIIVTRTVEPNI